ncbi:MAG: 16S rRNA processing protein RimM, partial [Methylobacteriaceae bacterium]|nr:16S rRNA processing protein RimM [Methylobacteriaceae bacterium]
MADASSKILVGVFGAAHGIRGEVRLKSYTGDPAAIGTYGPLQDESGALSFTLEAVRSIGKDMFVARVTGVHDRDSAERLSGTQLFMTREALPSADDEEFYHV